MAEEEHEEDESVEAGGAAGRVTGRGSSLGKRSRGEEYDDASGSGRAAIKKGPGRTNLLSPRQSQ